MAPRHIEHLHGHAYIDALLAWELRSETALVPAAAPAKAAEPRRRPPRHVVRPGRPAAAPAPGEPTVA